MTLVAAYDGAYGGFNFDGYAAGQLLVTVPSGWRLVVRCRNASSRRVSCAMVRGPGSGGPVAPLAATSQPRIGLAPGGAAGFSVRLERAGGYRIVSLVPGEEEAGMWVVLDVRAVPRPSIRTLR